MGFNLGFKGLTVRSDPTKIRDGRVIQQAWVRSLYTN